MKDRILRLIREEQLTPAKFADILGVQRSSISHYLSGRNNPSLEFVQKILLKFKNINPDWMILGKGEMYKNLGNSQLTGEKQNELFPFDTPVSPLESKKTDSTEFIPEILENKEVLSNKETSKVFDKQISIERIVIFYNNKTFKEYFPS